MRKLAILLALVPLLARADLFGFAGGASFAQRNGSWTVPDCVSAPTSLTSCQTTLDALTSGNYTLVVNYQYSGSVAVNNVISMDPVAGAMLSFNGTETLAVSLGAFTPVTGGKAVSSLRPAGGSRMRGF